VDEAEVFLRDRGLLTRTADCALPSLYEACHEDPCKIGGVGFAAWPATKWPWFGELAGRSYLVAAVHRGKNLLVTGEVARLLDPICRAEIERMRAADRGWARLLDLPPRVGRWPWPWQQSSTAALAWRPPLGRDVRLLAVCDRQLVCARLPTPEGPGPV
jgi:hypothetical protein